MNSPIPLEDQVPIPPKHLRTGVMLRHREAIGAMEVGQSFVTDHNKIALLVAQRLGVKVTTRKLDGTGYRVWRVDPAMLNTKERVERV